MRAILSFRYLHNIISDFDENFTDTEQKYFIYQR